MIQETRDGVERDVERGVEHGIGSPSWCAALRRLPQPLHLLEFVTGSQHYHFGCYEHAGEALHTAQDRMALWGAKHFVAGSSVLDVGCGLGGTSRLLAARGFDVVALDPCTESLVYARHRARTAGGPRPRYVAGRLEDYARSARVGAEGALAIEVLQNFRDLEVFFGCCRSLLRPGAALVLHDVSTSADVDWSRVPHRRRGRVAAAAEAAGFRACEHADLSQAILPTLPCWARALEAERAQLEAAFVGTRRAVGAELSQLLSHMGALQRAFEHGELFYDSMVFRSGSPRSVFPCA